MAYSQYTRAQKTEERFWSYVPVSGRDDCWEWSGQRNENGYGRFKSGGTKGPAHRFAYELINGPIPIGLIIRHTCDNPPCVNPHHLLVGTAADNSRDMVERGRSILGRRWKSGHTKTAGHPNFMPGSLNPLAKLSAADIPVIRKRCRSGEMKLTVAASYGVVPGAISDIMRGITWRWVPEEDPEFIENSPGRSNFPNRHVPIQRAGTAT